MKREEAIRRIKAWKLDSDDMEVLAAVIPELRESEDERIMKNCIHFLELQKQHHAATFEIEECIAWLEKQKEYTDTKQERIIKAARRVLNNWLYGDVSADVSGDLTELEYAFKDYDGEEEQKKQKPEERFKEAREKYQVEWSEEEIEKTAREYASESPGLCRENDGGVWLGDFDKPYYDFMAGVDYAKSHISQFIINSK